MTARRIQLYRETYQGGTTVYEWPLDLPFLNPGLRSSKVDLMAQGAVGLKDGSERQNYVDVRVWVEEKPK